MADFTSRGLDSGINMLKEFMSAISEQNVEKILDVVSADIIAGAQNNLQQGGHIVIGELIGSVRVLEKAPGIRIVGTDKFQGEIIENGRGAVRPVNKKYLHFITKDGKEVFTKYSKPYAPHPWLAPAVLDTNDKYSRSVVEDITSKIQSKVSDREDLQ